MLPVIEVSAHQHLEKLMIEIYKPHYNLRQVEIGSFTYKHTPEAIKKIGDVHRGKIVSDETRKRMSDSRSARRTSDEERKSRSEAAKKRWADPEKRAALVAAQKAGVAAKPPRKYPGRKLTDEHRAKLREAARKRWQRVRDSQAAD